MSEENNYRGSLRHVLDHGYVRLADYMGNDLSVVNAAKVSFNKESTKFTDRDSRILNFLAREEHSSPFRHAFLSYEVYAPLMVARQWWKYVVGSDHIMDGWNESCLPADQVINSWNEKDKTIAELMNDGFDTYPVRSVNLKDNLMVPNYIKNIWDAGKAEVFEIVDALGHTLKVTGNHRVRTPDGWLEADRLAVGDLLLHNTDRAMFVGSAKIVRISNLGQQVVYDIEMKNEPNFIAGNILVHNSRRYITEEPELYLIAPDQWRSAPENKKQGSGDIVPLEIGSKHTARLVELYENSIKLYDEAIADDICVEQARVFLPAYALYVRWRWSASLQSVAHFLSQRLAHDAQKEIQLFAMAVNELTQPVFPKALEAYLNKGAQG